jgi:hypothetical protein
LPEGEIPEHQPKAKQPRAESRRAAEEGIQPRISRIDTDKKNPIRVNPCPSVVNSLSVQRVGGPETGPALRAKEDKQPRQPKHGVVQTGSPPKRPDLRPFKEQTVPSHYNHNTIELALCKQFLPRMARMDTDSKSPCPGIRAESRRGKAATQKGFLTGLTGFKGWNPSGVAFHDRSGSCAYIPDIS